MQSLFIAKIASFNAIKEYYIQGEQQFIVSQPV